jgi:hypothetical protein
VKTAPPVKGEGSPEKAVPKKLQNAKPVSPPDRFRPVAK